MDKDIQEALAIGEAYKAGYDCGENGSNTINCNFKHFATPGRMEAWTLGKDNAEAKDESHA